LQRSAVRVPDAAVPPALARLSGGFSSVAFAYSSGSVAALLAASMVLSLCQRALVEQMAMAIDSFGLVNHVKDGESPVMERSPAGGAVTAAALAAVSLIALYFIINAFSLDNVAVVSSIGVLHDGMLAAFVASGVSWLEAPPSGPGAQAEGDGGAEVASAPGFSGLQVRMLAMGEPGKCAAPLSWSSRGGLATGAWLLEAARPPLPLPAAAAAGCPAGATNFSSIVFSCKLHV